MTFNDYKKDLLSVIGNIEPNITQICKATGYSRDYIRSKVYHLNYKSVGKAKRYALHDVATVLYADFERN